MSDLFKKIILSIIISLPSLSLGSQFVDNDDIGKESLLFSHSLEPNLYDFSAPCSSGQTLYYSLISDSTVQVVPPAGYSWSGYTMPTGGLVIPETVIHDGVLYKIESIGRNAFFYCDGLTGVVIPNSVFSIGNQAFCHCEELTSLTLSESLEIFGDSSFFYCNHLQSLVIPNSVTEIGRWAFGYCDALPSVTIGSSVSLIKQNAFPTPLQSVVSLNHEAPLWSGSPFQWNSTSTPIYIPIGSLASYQSRWTRFYLFIETDFSQPDSAANVCIDSCTYKVVGYDSYGDGWNGGQLTVMQNSLPVLTFTIEDGGVDSCSFKVCKSGAISIVWYQGSWNEEVSFSIYDEESTMVYSTYGPPSGLLHTMTPNCSDCHIPQAVTTTVNRDSVFVTWAPGNEGMWNVAIGPFGSNPDDLTIYQVNEPSFAMGNLANGAWNVFVRVQCSDENSNWVATSFFVGEYLMRPTGTDTLFTCNMVIFDDGGPNGNYSNNSNSTLFIFPEDSTKALRVEGTSYTESTYDYLRIYDGIGTNGTCIFDDYGLNEQRNIGPYTSDGPVTVVFHSDGSVIYSGYQINVSCTERPCQTTLLMYSNHYIGGWGDYRGSLSLFKYGGQEIGTYQIANSPAQSFTTSFRQDWDSIRLVWNHGSWDDGDRFLLKDNLGVVRYTVMTNGQSNMNISDTRGNSWNNVNNITLPMSCSDSTTVLHHITFSEVQYGDLTVNGFDYSNWDYVLDSSIITIAATPGNNSELQYLKVNGEIVASPFTMTVTSDVSVEVSFLVNLPELHVTNLTCSDLVSGHDFSVSWTVQNDGTQPTPVGTAWQDKLYLSTVPYLDYNSIADAELIGTYDNMTALGVGESYTNTITSSLPLQHSTGTYYLFLISNSSYAFDIEWTGDTVPAEYNPPPYVMAKSYAWERMAWDDESTIINEISEQGTWIYDEWGFEPYEYKHDNFNMNVVNVSPPPTADLQVTSIHCDTNLISNTPLSVTATITNAGTETTMSSGWSDCIYVSNDSVLSSNDVLLTCSDHNASGNNALGVGDSYQVTFNCSIPAEMSGDLYFFVVTDKHNAEYENPSEDNNVTRSHTLHVTLAPWADIVVSDIGFVYDPSSQYQLSIAATVSNVGLGTTNVSEWADRVYISTSPILPDACLDEWGGYMNYDEWRYYDFTELTDWCYCLETVTHYGVLSDTDSYTLNRSYPMPYFIADSGQGKTFYIVVISDANEQVFENGADTNNMSVSMPMTIPNIVAGLPDLHVSQITHSNPVAGMPMTVQWTVTNDGEGPTPTGKVWHDYIWLVSDADVRLYDDNDLHGKLLTTDNLTALAAGESYTNSVTVTIPPDYIGNYYLFVFTDQVDAFNIDFSASGGVAPNPYQPNLNGYPYPYLSGYVHENGLVTEMSGKENDNFFYKVLSILAPTTPDLAVTHISHPTDVFSGNEIEVSWTVTNQGNTIAIGQWSDALFLQPGGGDELSMATAIQLGAVPHTGTVEIDSAYTNTYRVTVPAECSGLYSVFVSADFDNDLYESIYELNNTISSGHTINVNMTPPPDLVVSQMTFVDDASPNGDYSLSFTVTNTGLNATRTGHWRDAVYFSRNNVFDNTASLVMKISHEGVLERDSSYYVDTVIKVRNNMVGKWYVYIVTDVENNIFEYNFESNNWTMDSVMVKDLDLSVESVFVSDTTVSPGESITISYQVKNNGNGTVLNSQWRDAVYLTLDESFDVESAIPLGSVRHGGILAHDSSYTKTINVVVPSSIAMGSYHIWIVTDVSNTVFENESEDNNRMCYPSLLAVSVPDLIISSVVVPDTINAGQQFLVRWTVSNVGNGNVVNRSFVDEIRYNGNVIYRQAISNETLMAGDSVIRSTSVDLDCGQFSSAFLEVLSDVDNSLFESNDENNSRSSAEMIVNYPDLTIVNVEVIDTARSGKMVTVRWVVRNVGTGVIENQNILDEVYLNNNSNSFVDEDSRVRHLHAVTLEPGQDDTVTVRVRIPDGLSGDYYFHVVTNIGDSVCQGYDDESDEAHSESFAVQLSPYPDLQILEVLAPEQVTMGAQDNITIVFVNNGFGDLVNKQVTTNLYYSMSPTLYDPVNVLSSHTCRLTLAMGVQDTQTVSVRIPAALYQANYYVYAVVDVNNEIYEYNGEENNTSRSDVMTVVNYPLDLAAVNIQGPNYVTWGQQAHYTLSVQNVSSVPTLSSMWKDEIYLATSSTLNGGETRLVVRNRNETLAADGTYSIEFDVEYSLGQPSPLYLIASVDVNHENPDVDRGNNIVSMQITVEPIPTPDVSANRITLLDNLVSGQPSRLVYRTINSGDAQLINVSYTDKVFLSTDSQLGSDDVEVGNLSHYVNTLGIQNVMTDTIDFTVPLSFFGNVYVIVKLNANVDFYETNTHNNVLSQAATVVLPPPGDFVVESVDGDDSVVCGGTIHLSWTIVNAGDNVLSGRKLRSMVYLSVDNRYDAEDIQLGYVQEENISLGSGEQLEQTLSQRVSGVKEGDYYVIVKTDVLNSFNEVDKTNNIGVSLFPNRVKVRELRFNTLTLDTLLNYQISDYKLVVGDNRNETVRISVNTPDSLMGAVNMIYVKHNDVSDNLNYDFSTIGNAAANAELFIPATQQGYYGVSVQGVTPSGDNQDVTLLAEILPFELLGVSPTYGGNTGRVTVELTGSRFRPDMRVWLAKGTDTIFPDTLVYVNYYKAYSTFDLTDKDTGVYDVGALNYCDGVAGLLHSFHIEQGQAMTLSTNLLFPNSPRPNRMVILSLEFGNLGNTDIINPVVVLQSHGECPIALTPEGLAAEATSIRIPLRLEDDYNGILRPGTSGSIQVYCYTSGPLVFSVYKAR